MFRLISAEGEPPLFLLCDHPHCRKQVNGKIPPGVEEQAAVFGFIQALGAQGWQIKPYGTYCPEHHDAVELKPVSPIVLASEVPGVMRLVPR